MLSFIERFFITVINLTISIVKNIKKFNSKENDICLETLQIFIFDQFNIYLKCF